MKIKLKEAIRCGGIQHRAPAVIDTEAVGLSDAEALFLIRRGSAVEHVEAEAVEEIPAPAGAEVVSLELGNEPEVEAVADAEEIEAEAEAEEAEAGRVRRKR